MVLLNFDEDSSASENSGRRSFVNHFSLAKSVSDELGNNNLPRNYVSFVVAEKLSRAPRATTTSVFHACIASSATSVKSLINDRN